MRTPLLHQLLQAVERVARDRRGALAPIYALVFVTMIMALGAGIDMSNGLQVKYQLDLAADAGAVACGETWQNYMEAGTSYVTDTTDFTNLTNNALSAAKAAGQDAFEAQAGLLNVVATGKPTRSTPTILTPGSPVITTSITGTAQNNFTCKVGYTANNLNFLMQIANIQSLAVQGASQTLVELAPYVNVYLVLDTSASMMVGSTPADEQLVATWVAKPANTSKVLQPNGDNSPCAFACHEEPGSFKQPPIDLKAQDVQLGETYAHQAGATTRFDIMQQALVNDPVQQVYCSSATPLPANTVACNTGENASEGLLTYIRINYSATNTRANLNTFSYGVYGFNESFMGYTGVAVANDVVDYSEYYSQPPGWTKATPLLWPATSMSSVVTDVGKLTIGFDTHFNAPVYSGQTPVGQALVNFIGTVPSSPAPGVNASNPQKFVIMVTDGMNSDRNWNYGGNSSSYSAPPSGITYTLINSNPGESNLCKLWTANPPGPECNNSSYKPAWWTTNPPSGETWAGYTKVGYGGPFNTSYCSSLKSNGAILAILETPYVPLNGQDPIYYPYEGTVQYTQFPGGAGTASAVSAALQSCASPGYYFQAADNAQIASGFIQLFNTFVGQFVHINQ